MEQKTSLQPAQLKANFGERIIEGYASTFGNVDLVGDVIEKGAFRKTLADRLPRKLIKVCLDHGWPIGMPAEGCAEDGTGLWTRSKISAVPEGDKALQFVEDGICAHMSIGYDVVKREFIESSDPQQMPIRRLTELRLYEWSPVLWPANEQASILGMKALNEALAEAHGRIPELTALLRKKGFLNDPELDLVQHLGGVVRNAIASAIKALSEGQPEPAAVVPPAATTPPVEPPPTAGKSADPEEGLYGVALELSALKAQLDASAALRFVAGP